jgi:ketosteroid isomerase-like protein
LRRCCCSEGSVDDRGGWLRSGDRSEPPSSGCDREGNPEAFFELYSHRDDATLANPYGPPARGWTQIEQAGRRAASNYRDGRAIEFENIAKCVTAELGYMLEIERFEAKVAGSDEVTPVALRVTSVFRPEDGTWKLVHRHADPITTSRPGESVIQT